MTSHDPCNCFSHLERGQSPMKLRLTRSLACLLFAASSLYAAAEPAHRTNIPLNGQWDVDDSVSPDAMPKTYPHKVPVPGLTHSAVPAFADIDQYQSRQFLNDLVRQGELSPAEYAKIGDF